MSVGQFAKKLQSFQEGRGGGAYFEKYCVKVSLMFSDSPQQWPLGIAYYEG